MAGTTGLEPATSAVTGQRSNQLSYVPQIQTSKRILIACSRKSIPCAVRISFRRLTVPSRVRAQVGTMRFCSGDMNECIRKLKPCAKLDPRAVTSGAADGPCCIPGNAQPGVRRLEPSAAKMRYADQAARLPRPLEVYPISIEMPRTHCSSWLAIEGSFCAVTRNDGPEMLTAATGRRCASSRGTAMQRNPSSSSSSSTA